MDFDKKIAYMYDCEDKEKSIGFAKWDVRNGMLKLQINVKVDNYTKDGDNLVSFGFKGGQRTELGHIKITDGAGDFRYMGRADNVQNSGIGYITIEEVIISRDGIDEIYGCLSEKKEIVNGYEKIYAEKRRVELFSDNDVYDCVEIEPEDIKNVPNTNWALMNNSFLNHGFYAFRHLILGKQYKSDGFDYVIGVPGIYTSRDKSMANMFGFLHFKFSTRSDIRLSQFGYWYRALAQ